MSKSYCYYQVPLLIIFILLSQQINTLPAPTTTETTNTYNYNAGAFINHFCVDHETGRELYVGEMFNRPGKCIRIQCLGNYQIWEDRCRIPKLKGNCTELPVANELMNYPKCCPLYECVSYQANEYGKAIETRTFDHHGVQRKAVIVQEFLLTKPRYVSSNSTKPHAII